MLYQQTDTDLLLAEVHAGLAVDDAPLQLDALPSYLSPQQAGEQAYHQLRQFCQQQHLYWCYSATLQRGLLLGFGPSRPPALSQHTLHTLLQLYQDMLLRLQFEKQLQQRALTDPLTQLPNRSVAFDRLQQALHNHNGNKLTFTLFVDLSRFKDVNEVYGHDKGDLILKEVADRIRHTVRENDTVATLGGDEFLIILENASKPKTAQVVASKVIDAIAQPVTIDQHELILSCNIGIAAYPGDGLTPSELIRNADTAMYNARKQGLNRFQFFTQAMNQEISRRLALEQALHQALRNQEFSLHFQPVVDCQSGAILGCEALLRWHSSKLGKVSPATFIPIAEEDGLIVPIGNWVMERALAQLSLWHQLGFDQLHMAINVSVKQLLHPDFAEQLSAYCQHYRIVPHHVVLEITESTLMSGHQAVISLLEQLRQQGFALSIDDFGTGYSALSYLNRYPFDFLKIDRSFITNLTDSDKDKTLIDAIIAMAHKLDMKVIAEGAETPTTLDYLSRQHCDMVQGYVISQPLPANDFLTLLQKAEY